MSFEDKKNSSESGVDGIDQDKDICPQPLRKSGTNDQGQNIYPPDGQELQVSDSQVNTKKTLPDSKVENSDKNALEPSEKHEDSKEPKPRDKNLFEGNVDQKLYDEVLEKLDMKPRQDIQEKSMQESKQEAYPDKFQEMEKSQLKNMVESAIVQDFSRIQKLVQTGLINSVQGQNLRKQVLQRAFDKLVQTEKMKRNLSPALNQHSQFNKHEVFEEFNKSNPDFFNSDGRKEVLEYLKTNDAIFGKEELNKISDIVRIVEKNAIDRYLKKAVHEKTLRDSNESAKQRLTANAQKSGSSGNLLRTFTREQIGKMTGAEFSKYESQIMDQLKKGLIR